MSLDGTGTSDIVHSVKARDAIPLASAGSPDDPVMREALRLIEAFLAIADPTGQL